MAREQVMGVQIRPVLGARRAGQPIWSGLVLAAASAVGLGVFLYPFFLSEGSETSGPWGSHSNDAPLIFGIVLGLCLLLFVLELARQGMNAKTASALAVLMVAAAVLRLPTLPAGGTAFFFVVILGGYVFGPRFGFLLGAGALFVSAFAVGGFGPWLPFQMFACGWVGLTAGWLGGLREHLRRHPWLEVGSLAGLGVLWGFLFGAIMNVWFWPFLALGEEISWRPGLGLGDSLRHYWSFYILTSAGWDIWRAAANGLLMLLMARPVLSVLGRFRERFQVEFDRGDGAAAPGASEARFA
jgi:energy-coupling factor transport system substrate-specific component